MQAVDGFHRGMTINRDLDIVFIPLVPWSFARLHVMESRLDHSEQAGLGDLGRGDRSEGAEKGLA